MRCAEIRVTGELHDFELTESLGQPVADGRPPQIVEGAPLNAGASENLAKRPVEDGDDLLA